MMMKTISKNEHWLIEQCSGTSIYYVTALSGCGNRVAGQARKPILKTDIIKYST